MYGHDAHISDCGRMSHLLGDHGNQESTGPEVGVDCIQASFDSIECAFAIISTAKTDGYQVACASGASLYNGPGQVPCSWQSIMGTSHSAHGDFKACLSWESQYTLKNGNLNVSQDLTFRCW